MIQILCLRLHPDDRASTYDLPPVKVRPEARSSIRIGPARILRYAFDGNDLGPLRAELEAYVTEPGAAMDLSVVEQILGHPDAGLRIQDEALKQQRLYRSPGSVTSPRLRVLALAAPLDVGGNAPIEFLVVDPEIELTTLYVVPGASIEDTLPEHDVAIVIMSEGDDCAESLRQITAIAADWPRPLLNAPDRIARTERDCLFEVLQPVKEILIPVNVRVSREQLDGIAQGTTSLPEGVRLPLVVRPVGSHAGKGLDRCDCAAEIDAYLATRAEAEFFIMPFVDYCGTDGLFRKYRIVFIDGQPFACHMAIADQWKIWYLNAGMADAPLKRAEEQLFMERFDVEFGLRHKQALAQIASRIGLDYFSIDCGETKDGRLLVFEAGVAMVVHDMDPADIYPYKVPQMKKVFDAFAAMLDRRSALADRVVLRAAG